MTDPLGLINTSTPAARLTPTSGLSTTGKTPEGLNFRETLEQQLAEVNKLQKDATHATEDIMAKRRDDVETVMIATRKADLAFKMLLQVRNKMMDAYDEVKQIRV